LAICCDMSGGGRPSITEGSHAHSARAIASLRAPDQQMKSRMPLADDTPLAQARQRNGNTGLYGRTLRRIVGTIPRNRHRSAVGAGDIADQPGAV
jgi:hypothetical protein